MTLNLPYRGFNTELGQRRYVLRPIQRVQLSDVTVSDVLLEILLQPIAIELDVVAQVMQQGRSAKRSGARSFIAASMCRAVGLRVIGSPVLVA